MAVSMASKEELREQLRIEREAIEDWADRVARNDPDWGLYFPGDARPHIPRWRRILKLRAHRNP
jgi:hypothetical protein